MSEPIELRPGVENVDFEALTRLLGGTYWVPGIAEWEVRTAAENAAYVVSAYQNGKQVGFARVISDKIRFAYFSDVVVDEGCRGQGIGHQMIDHILHCETLKNVYQWLLYTDDAGGFYARHGFAPLQKPGTWMEIRSPRPERP
ncbi:MAG: GNAT family N-acetyltransferase [Oscillospiraceae bacterium]